MDALFSKMDMRCTLCDTLASAGCSCWERCSCGWTAMRGFQCGNQATKKCSTKIKYKRQATQEEYWDASDVGRKAARKRKRKERRDAALSEPAVASGTKRS
jgi:hypothetical protein